MHDEVGLEKGMGLIKGEYDIDGIELVGDGTQSDSGGCVTKYRTAGIFCDGKGFFLFFWIFERSDDDHSSLMGWDGNGLYGFGNGDFGERFW